MKDILPERARRPHRPDASLNPAPVSAKRAGRLVISGYASLFNKADAAGDVIRPGAFRKTLGRRRQEPGRGGIAMLWQHDPSRPIGVWTHMAEDRHGLRVVGELLPSVALSREAAHLVASGALTGLSIGFRAVRALKSAASRTRTLIEIDLWEVSLVTFPQMEEARVRLVSPTHTMHLARST